MNTPMLMGLAVLAYLLFREYGTGQGGLTVTGTPAPAPAPAAGPTTSPADVALHQLQTSPTMLAQALMTVASQGGFPGNPTLNYDQWSWFATQKVQPVGLLTPPDFTSVAPRDAGGSTPSVTALQYATDYVRLKAAQSGMSGLEALGRGMGNVIDLRQTPISKWTM